VQVEEAARILSDMYKKALQKEKALSIHLFGVMYANEIRNIPSASLALRAGLKKSYGTEIRKGINLAKYVEIRSTVE
jgi:hypothetical protein